MLNSPTGPAIRAHISCPVSFQVDVDRVEWENKKTYSTVALVLGRDGKIYLRAADGLEDWFELLEECMLTSKERRRALRFSHDGKPRDNNNITNTLDEWLAARQKIREYLLFHVLKTGY